MTESDDALREAIEAQTAQLSRVADGLVLLTAELRAYVHQVHQLIEPGADGPDPMDLLVDAVHRAEERRGT